jgi:hypothetical protein
MRNALRSLCITLIGAVCCASPAWAQQVCDATATLEVGRITETVVSCVDLGVNATVHAMITAVYTELRAVIYGMVILSIAIFGLKVALGMIRSPLPEFSMQCIKVAAVVYYSQNIAPFYDAAVEVSKELMEWASRALIQGGVVECHAPLLPDYAVWANMDCLLMGMFGFGLSGTILTSLVGFIVSNFFSGWLGTYVTFAGVLFLLTLVFAVFRAVYTFVVAIVAIAFLFALAPLVIPCILFQFTAGYFNTWLQSIMTYILQPMILVALLTFMTIVYSFAIYQGPNSVVAMVLGHPVSGPTQFAADFMALAETGAMGQTRVTVGAQAREESIAITGEAPPGRENINEALFIDSKLPNAVGACVGKDGADLRDVTHCLSNTVFSTVIIDPTKLGKASQVAMWNLAGRMLMGQVTMVEIIQSFVMALIVGLMMMTMIEMAPKISQYLTGVTMMNILNDLRPPFYERVFGGRDYAGAINSVRSDLLQTVPLGPIGAASKAERDRFNASLSNIPMSLGYGFFDRNTVSGFDRVRQARAAEAQAKAQARGMKAE